MTEAVRHSEKGEGFESTDLSLSVGFLIDQICDFGQILNGASFSFSLKWDLITSAESMLLQGLRSYKIIDIEYQLCFCSLEGSCHHDCHP